MVLLSFKVLVLVVDDDDDDDDDVDTGRVSDTFDTVSSSSFSLEIGIIPIYNEATEGDFIAVLLVVVVVVHGLVQTLVGDNDDDDDDDSCKGRGNDKNRE